MSPFSESGLVQIVKAELSTCRFATLRPHISFRYSVHLSIHRSVHLAVCGSYMWVLITDCGIHERMILSAQFFGHLASFFDILLKRRFGDNDGLRYPCIAMYSGY